MLYTSTILYNVSIIESVRVVCLWLCASLLFVQEKVNTCLLVYDNNRNVLCVIILFVWNTKQAVIFGRELYCYYLFCKTQQIFKLDLKLENTLYYRKDASYIFWCGATWLTVNYALINKYLYIIIVNILNNLVMHD